MDNNERANAHVVADATVIRGGQINEQAEAHGKFVGWCIGPREDVRQTYVAMMLQVADLELNGKLKEAIALRIKAMGLLEEKWHDTAPNVVATVGKNLALDTYLAGSSYTVTGPYLGLISSTSFSAVAAGDTMASHSGWLEAGNANAPTYTSPRKTAAWSAASAGAKALSAALSFAITGTG